MKYRRGVRLPYHPTLVHLANPMNEQNIKTTEAEEGSGTRKKNNATNNSKSNIITTVCF